ncbi:hypothetical protein [Amycolatopsis sp. PS_44_ISF1]|uniref:hypothetical protein n=1 Tax=Amycolatopsis sp. PS_44_ISF1 TaxID=2974917 RepID=UPI0028DE18AB|nr:hypothetical protein [Amycolatopsis sp. PS_44_ISF1]MDT8915787.1 hypothetical protein [Amycolatopsis sp. PS_44_ISF1]MDT8916191.1 hypothetical protein [Amycolatopsis sp. PS_44_ISF1]
MTEPTEIGWTHGAEFAAAPTEGLPAAPRPHSLRAALPVAARTLVALNVRSRNTGVPIFAGIEPAEKRRRRAAGKRQRAARRVHRAA